MKLQAIEVEKDLQKLELGEIILFFTGNKSIRLVITENEAPKLVVKLKNEIYIFPLSEKGKAQELFDNSFVITQEIYNNSEKLKSFIENCDIDIRYEFKGANKYIKIDVENDGSFYWIYTNGWNNYYPMKNSFHIQTFKTEKGAKKSLIKYLGL